MRKKRKKAANQRFKFAPLAVFCTFFVAELGDKTQLTAITFGANEGMGAALVVWIGCSLGLFAADILRNAGWLSVKEQDSGWNAEYLGICDLLCIRCIHALSGTETDRNRCLSHSGMAGADYGNSRFCCFVCLSFYQKGEKESEINGLHDFWNKNGIDIMSERY